jgi:hypothetical protein
MFGWQPSTVSERDMGGTWDARDDVDVEGDADDVDEDEDEGTEARPLGCTKVVI